MFPSVRVIFLSPEYYLGTVPFKACRNAGTLRGELTCTSGNDEQEFSIDFFINIQNKPFSIPEHVADAISEEFKRSVNGRREELATDAKRVWPRKRETWNPSAYMTISAVYEADRFWFALKHKETKQGVHFHLVLYNEPASILPKLGYDDNLEVTPGHPVPGKTSWKIGDGDEHGGRSIRDQRIRSDSAFGELMAHVQKELKDLFVKNKERGYAHSGHILLADYLYSLVFLSIFRERGRTMRIKDGVERARNMKDSVEVKEFEDKLTDLCRVDVGATDDETRIKRILKEVSKVSETRVHDSVPPVKVDTMRAPPAFQDILASIPLLNVNFARVKTHELHALWQR